MRQIAEFCAVLSFSLFTGAAVYISLIEHPRMQCGVEITATEFPPSYRRACVRQVTLQRWDCQSRYFQSSQRASKNAAAPKQCGESSAKIAASNAHTDWVLCGNGGWQVTEKLAGLLTVLSQKTEHVIDPHGTAKVSEGMATSFLSVF